MKIFTKKSFVHKIVLSLVILILTTTVAPNYSYSVSWGEAGGSLLKEIIQLFASLGDAIMGALNGMMLGTQGFGSAMLTQDDPNMANDSGSWLKTNYNNAEETVVTIPAGYMDEKSIFDIGEYQIPNMLYCPENIFANRIAALDINFLNPNKYTSSTTGQTVEYDENASAAEQDKQISGAAVLRSSIATWYKSFRNIAIVGLLSVLVYLGIRILISTAASDKAKYKENLKDWLLALCLVFVMHIIMSGIIMITDKFTELFATATSTIKVVVSDGTWFYTNLTGLVRFKAQAEAWQDAVSYTVIYIALIIYTCIFTFMYFKRFLYTAFFTMIAPLVALTYPIDKAGDKKAQAFNLWFKEYTMNVIIQPVHLLLYTALISSAMDLVANNPLYGLVAIAFLVPAEKFIKKMFGIEADTTSGFGSFAGGALAMKALDKLGSGGGKKGSSGGGSKESGDAGKDKVRIQDRGETGKLNTFKKEEDPEEIARQQAREQERQRMLDDREAWEQIANDESGSDMDREEAREQLNMIDEDMRQRGYSYDEDDEDEQNAMEENDNVHTVESEQEQSSELEQNEEEPQAVQENGKWDKAKRVIKGAAPIAGGMLWSAAKGTAKLAAKTSATVGGAAIGLAAGLTTGDFSKTWQYMGAGAIAGNAIGDKISRVPASAINKVKNVKDNVTNKIDSVKDEYRANVDGYAAMQEQKVKRNNERARKAILKDKNEIRKYKEMAGELGYECDDIKDFMNIALDYKEAGIDDDKLIKNALRVEKANGGIGGAKHENIMDVARFTKDYGKDYIEDEKKRESLEKVVQSKVSNKASQKEIMETFADIHGRKDFYKKNSKLYDKPARQRQRSPQQPPQQPPRQQPPRQQPPQQPPRQQPPRQQPPQQ